MFSDFFSTYGPTVFGGALFLAFAWLSALWVERLVTRVLRNQADLDPAAVTLMVRFLRVSIVVLAGIAVLDELGIEIASLIAALGIFGFAIAIGLRTTSTNFFTGAMLYILKPYTVGDFIEGERVEGVVESMSYFHTVVVTKDGIYVAVPNAAMWARSIRNLSRARPRCVELDIVVQRGLAFAELQSVIERTLAAETRLHTEFGSLIGIRDVMVKTITIQAAFWCEAEHQRDLRVGVSEALRESLAAAGARVTRITETKKKILKKKPDKIAALPSSDDEG